MELTPREKDKLLIFTAALLAERRKARGFRLNIAAGTAVRFEPGQTRTVQLVAISGGRKIYGFNGKVMGAVK